MESAAFVGVAGVCSAVASGGSSLVRVGSLGSGGGGWTASLEGCLVTRCL